MFDQDGGRIMYFEGTYTTTFSGNDDPTPRYDYNQVMYRLDLADHRLALPVAIYEVPAEDGSHRLATRSGRREPEVSHPDRVAFFAPDRPGLASVPVYDEPDPNGGHRLQVGGSPSGDHGRSPLFYMRPDDSRAPMGGTVRLYESREEPGGRRTYSVEHAGRRARPPGEARVLGRVWPNPATALRW